MDDRIGMGRIVSRELLLGKSVCSVCGRPADVDHVVDPQVLLAYLEPTLKWVLRGFWWRFYNPSAILERVKEDVKAGESCDGALRRALSNAFSCNGT